MFLKRLVRHKDGKKHTYWAPVESIRAVRGSRRHVVAYLGELTRRERDGWSRLGRRLDGQGRPQPAHFDPPYHNDPTDDEPALVKLKDIRVQRLHGFGDVHHIPLQSMTHGSPCTARRRVVRRTGR